MTLKVLYIYIPKHFPIVASSTTTLIRTTTGRINSSNSWSNELLTMRSTVERYAYADMAMISTVTLKSTIRILPIWMSMGVLGSNQIAWGHMQSYVGSIRKRTYKNQVTFTERTGPMTRAWAGGHLGEPMVAEDERRLNFMNRARELW